MTESNNVSVVIATLGGVLLKSTIVNLNSGSVKPFEILLCIPSNFYHRVSGYDFPNVRVIKTNVKGQVAQRAKGFLSAKCSYVLQLDDDINLHNHCIKSLLTHIKKNKSTSACPVLYDNDSKKYHSFMVFSNTSSFFDKIILKIINGSDGYVPGKISKSGVNMGLPEFPGDYNDLDWVPGACVLHRKENLVTFNYFPLKGKAYAEDLFHSHYLIKKGVYLNRVGEAKCYVDFKSNKVSFFGLFESYNAYLKSMRIFIKLIDASNVRLHIYVLVRIIQLIFNKSIKFQKLLFCI